MGFCGEHKDMDQAAFGNHIHDKATELKNAIAKKAAQTVHERGQMVQKEARDQLEYQNTEARNEAIRNGQDPYAVVPKTIGPDHGYSLLGDGAKKWVDDYKRQYHVDLLTFTTKHQFDAEEKLKTHLNYIVEEFDRSKNFADPKKIDPVLEHFNTIAGDGALAQISFDASQKSAAGATKANSATGQLGSPAFSYCGGMAGSIEAWDAPTAVAFRNYYLPGIPTAVTNQIAAIRTVRNLLATNQSVAKFARQDIDELVHDGITAVEHFQDCKEGDDDTSATVGIIGGIAGVIAGIAGIVSGVVTGGASLFVIAAGAGTFVNGAMSVHQNSLKNTVSKDLSGSTIDQVLEKILGCVDETYGKLDEFNTTLADQGFNTVQQLMTGGDIHSKKGDAKGQKSLYLAPRPADEFMNADQGNVRKVTD